MSRTRRIPLLALGCIVVAASGGCDDAKVITSANLSASSSKKPAAAASPSASAVDGGAEQEEARRFREEDFVETEQSRDPFRSFSKAFSKENTTVVQAQREVLLERYSLDELKLVGIVTGHDEPRAMFVDPVNVGWIVRRGQFIGKADVVRSQGGASFERNWRVDRIRDGDVVLIREDASRSDATPETRVIQLRPEDTAGLGR